MWSYKHLHIHAFNWFHAACSHFSQHYFPLLYTADKMKKLVVSYAGANCQGTKMTSYPFFIAKKVMGTHILFKTTTKPLFE